MGNWIEYEEGQRIGKCTFIKDVIINKPSDKQLIRRAVFKCDCGKEFIQSISGIKSMNNKSCGCGLYRLNISNKTKHGLSNHRIYKMWASMKSRCYNKNHGHYKHYGGRGISIHKEWRDDFKAFFDCVTQLPHYNEHGRTLDRINNDGNYKPGNVRWADGHTQAVNKNFFLGDINARGVHGCGSKYAATICINYNNIQLGAFSTIKEALQARNKYIIDNNLTEYPIQELP